MKKGMILTLLGLLVLSIFLFGCSSQSKVKSCGYETNEMVTVTGEIIDTHPIIDKSKNPPLERTIVTIRTPNCDLFALKDTIDYQMTKSEDTLLKVSKICIPENSGPVSFEGLYREYTIEGFTYDITPSFCSKESEPVTVDTE